MKCYKIETSHWYIERVVYLVGGFFVAASTLLGLLVHANWLYFTLFVGIMFMNFALTGYCPMAIILNKCGIKKN